MWPGPPRAPPTPLSLSVLVGEVGVVTSSPSRTSNSGVYFRPGGEGWCCDQAPLAHPRLCHGFSNASESQLTLRISTRMSSVGSLATTSADNNIPCTSKPNTKRYILPLQFNGADLYLFSNYYCCGVTTSAGTSLNPRLPLEYFPGGTGGGVYSMGTYNWEGGGLDKCQTLFVTPVPFHPILFLVFLL